MILGRERTSTSLEVKSIASSEMHGEENSESKHGTAEMAFMIVTARMQSLREK